MYNAFMYTQQEMQLKNLGQTSNVSNVYHIVERHSSYVLFILDVFFREMGTQYRDCDVVKYREMVVRAIIKYQHQQFLKQLRNMNNQ